MENSLGTKLSLRFIQEGVVWPFNQVMGTTVEDPTEEQVEKLFALVQDLMPENAVLWSIIKTSDSEFRHFTYMDQFVKLVKLTNRQSKAMGGSN